ncbi:MAG: DnaJ domain-containing protein, partial [Proteobacteria bacterium]|nr:DnaJ domain-containing protein [Pseudomonadota bacterium]
MARNPYAVLGVAKDASADDIQKAYRKLAKELHPDLNPGNPKTADRFKEISSAYSLLRDVKARARFGRGEIDEAGTEKPQKFYRDFADGPGARTYHTTSGFDDLGEKSDLFADLFGRARSGKPGGRKGQDALFRLEIDFADAVKGATKRITLPDGGTL